MSEPAAQQQQSQNGKERSKSTEEKEVPREPALVLKDIDVSPSSKKLYPSTKKNQQKCFLLYTITNWLICL